MKVKREQIKKGTLRPIYLMTLRREAFDNHLQTTSRESTKRYKASLPKGLQDRIFAQLAKLDTPRRGPIVQARNHGLFEANASFTPSFAFGVAPSWGTFLKPERGERRRTEDPLWARCDPSQPYATTVLFNVGSG